MGDKWGGKNSDFFPVTAKVVTPYGCCFLFYLWSIARWESWQISTVKLDGRFDIQYERVGDTAESHQQIMLFFFPQHRMSEAAASGREKYKLTKPSAVVFTSMVLYFLRLAIRNWYRSFWWTKMVPSMYLFCNKSRKKLTMAHKGSSSFDWDSVEKEGSAWNWKVLQQDKQDPIYKMKIISFRCCIFCSSKI